MLYSGKSAVDKLNRRIQSYKETWGDEGYRTERAVNKIFDAIPDKYIADGVKILKPETVFKEVGGEVLEKLLKEIPTVQDIYLQSQEQAEPDERQTITQWKQTRNENERIRQSISNNLDKLYTYKGGKRVAVNKSAQNIIDVLRESNKSKDAINWASEKIESLEKKKRVMPYRGIRQRNLFKEF